MEHGKGFKSAKLNWEVEMESASSGTEVVHIRELVNISYDKPFLLMFRKETGFGPYICVTFSMLMGKL